MPIHTSLGLGTHVRIKGRRLPRRACYDFVDILSPCVAYGKLVYWLNGWPTKDFPPPPPLSVSLLFAFARIYMGAGLNIVET